MGFFDIFSNQPQEKKLIPSRSDDSITGSQFCQNNFNLNGPLREQNILKEFLAGNIPNFLRNFVSIDVTDGTNSMTYLVMSDVLSIGSDDDYIRMPMGPKTAKQIANQYDCSLPTKKMCDQIFKAAEIKLQPYPHAPDSEMMQTERIQWHSQQITNQLAGKDKTKLITGHKKDVVIDKQLIVNSNKVGIYGWFYPTTGMAIQGPGANCSSHDINYLDYSHGIRIVAQDVIVNGEPKRLFDVLKDKNYASLISEQGPYDATNIYL